MVATRRINVFFEFLFVTVCDTTALHRETTSSSTVFLWSLGKTPIHSGTSSVSNPDPNWVRIQLGQRIQARIHAAQIVPQKRKNEENWCLKRLKVLWRCIWRFLRKKSNCYFLNFVRKNLDSYPDWIRIRQNTWIRIVLRLGEPTNRPL